MPDEYFYLMFDRTTSKWSILIWNPVEKIFTDYLINFTMDRQVAQTIHKALIFEMKRHTTSSERE